MDGTNSAVASADTRSHAGTRAGLYALSPARARAEVAPKKQPPEKPVPPPEKPTPALEKPVPASEKPSPTPERAVAESTPKGEDGEIRLSPSNSAGDDAANDQLKSANSIYPKMYDYAIMEYEKFLIAYPLAAGRAAGPDR